jgi:amidase
MAPHDELSQVTAAELAGRIRRRELSPVEVMDAAIARIEAGNARLNAFVHLDLDQARERARQAEHAVASGAELGPLHGIPTAMKDLFDFKPGWPTTFGGVRALRDFVVDFYCAWAERMERAGAIIVGKTNSPVMGFRGTCDNPLFGPSRNPFDTSRNTGGSSGGSAAAVAAGLLPVAEGTDGGGSIRIPASWCGIYGYKQSFGRVPYVARPNAFTGIHPFLFEGTLARTVEDAALVTESLAGYDPRDPFALDDRPALTSALRRSIRGWRIAYSPDFDVFPVAPEVAVVVADAVRAFEEAGAHVEEVKLGIERDQRELSDLWCRLIIPINIATFESFKREGMDLLGDHRDDFPQEYLRWVDEGYELRTRRPDARRGAPQRDLRRDPERARGSRAHRHSHPRMPARRERRRRQHQGPDPDQRHRGRSAHRLVPDLPRQLLRTPRRVHPRRHGRGAARRHATHRAPLRRCRRARRQRRVRTTTPVARQLPPDRPGLTASEHA